VQTVQPARPCFQRASQSSAAHESLNQISEEGKGAKANSTFSHADETKPKTEEKEEVEGSANKKGGGNSQRISERVREHAAAARAEALRCEAVARAAGCRNFERVFRVERAAERGVKGGQRGEAATAAAAAASHAAPAAAAAARARELPRTRRIREGRAAVDAFARDDDAAAAVELARAAAAAEARRRDALLALRDAARLTRLLVRAVLAVLARRPLHARAAAGRRAAWHIRDRVFGARAAAAEAAQAAARVLAALAPLLTVVLFVVVGCAVVVGAAAARAEVRGSAGRVCAASPAAASAAAAAARHRAVPALLAPGRAGRVRLGRERAAERAWRRAERGTRVFAAHSAAAGRAERRRVGCRRRRAERRRGAGRERRGDEGRDERARTRRRADYTEARERAVKGGRADATAVVIGRDTHRPPRADG
jgi:hypothetical protein